MAVVAVVVPIQHHLSYSMTQTLCYFQNAHLQSVELDRTRTHESCNRYDVDNHSDRIQSERQQVLEAVEEVHFDGGALQAVPLVEDSLQISYTV